MPRRTLVLIVLAVAGVLGVGWRLLGGFGAQQEVLRPAEAPSTPSRERDATLLAPADVRAGLGQRAALQAPQPDLAQRAEPVDAGAPIRVTGRVLDTRGAPRDQHFVGFSPAESPAPTSPSEWLSLPHARTDARGEFLALLPREGAWRLFVGFGGQVLVEDPSPRHVTRGAPGIADVVVPADARLEVRLADAGAGAGTASGTTGPAPRRTVSVYRMRRAAELERRAPLAASAGAPDFGPHLDDGGFDESAPDPNAAPRPVLSPLVERLHALRAGAAPEGFVVVFSALTDRAGRAVFERVPVGEELRFAVSRGDEALRVEGSAFVPEGALALVRIELPPALAEDAALPETLRSVALQFELDAAAESGAPRTVGVTWR
ncbi:MAG: hypothetical protein R3F49_06500 [Planctomycetota bacterium]